MSSMALVFGPKSGHQCLLIDEEQSVRGSWLGQVVMVSVSDHLSL